MILRKQSPSSETVPPSPGTWGDHFGVIATRCLQALIVLTVAVVVIYGLVQLQVVFIPILLALIIASACAPFVSWLTSKGLPSLAATLIALFAAVVVLGGFLTLIVETIRADWSQLVDSANQGLGDLQDFLRTTSLPVDLSQLQQVQQKVMEYVTSGAWASGALSGVSAVSEIATGAVLTCVVLFFFLKDGPEMWSFLISPLNEDGQKRARRIGTKSVQVFGGYIRGTASVAFVDALGIGIALAILDVPMALALSAVVFLGAFIPLIGAVIAGVLAALVALVSNGIWVAIIVVAVVIVVNQLEGNLLQPVLMGNAVKLHSLVILLALAIGTVLGGIIGAILSVPIAAVAWSTVKTWNEPSSE